MKTIAWRHGMQFAQQSDGPGLGQSTNLKRMAAMKEASSDLWTLQQDIVIKPETATEAANIACTLTSLSAYAGMTHGNEGMETVTRIIVV
ncbi:MAG: hypothetical protein HXY26_04605 [Hydrogenophilaceae bacterium]|nr:hypothetical protein [Hydrogenophilaceae bacterium]